MAVSLISSCPDVQPSCSQAGDHVPGRGILLMQQEGLQLPSEQAFTCKERWPIINPSAPFSLSCNGMTLESKGVQMTSASVYGYFAGCVGHHRDISCKSMVPESVGGCMQPKISS